MTCNGSAPGGALAVNVHPENARVFECLGRRMSHADALPLSLPELHQQALRPGNLV